MRVCDRCKKTDQESDVKGTAIYRVPASDIHNTMTNACDLCPECFDLLGRIVKDFLQQPSASHLERHDDDTIKAMMAVASAPIGVAISGNTVRLGPRVLPNYSERIKKGNYWEAP